MAEKKIVVTELLSVCNLQLNEGESAGDFARRLAAAANDMSNDAWQGLTTASQKWVNAALEAVEKNEALPLPSGIETLMLQAGTGGASVGSKGEKNVASKAKSGQSGAAKNGRKKTAVQSSRPGPKGKFGPLDKIKVLTDGNPYREGTKSHAWFEKYKVKNATVQTALDAGTTRRHLSWAVQHEYLKIG